MPVRSLTSRVLKWPERAVVLAAAQTWAASLYANDANVLRVGCFGSYARGDAGVGSDLDLVLIVRERPKRNPDASRLPVPADVLVFDQRDWDALRSGGTRLARTLAAEAHWFPRDA